ncbi:MAG TPA: protein kinase [Terracidiphilus sp.]|nr:protein kinase [Terracidiphilus sp.]
MLHSSQRWQQIEALFHECLDLPEESRAAFLDKRCGEDAELRKEVESLLESSSTTMDFLNDPVKQAAFDFSNGSASHMISPGNKIGRYEILSCIGAGGMGQVYLAMDEVLRRKIAIKVLAPSLVNNDHGLRRFEKEALAASALNHPNILTIYEFGVSEGRQFIASEYVEGETLRQLLGKGALPIDQAVDIAIQIAKALETAHASGIVHRDIKPENIVIRKDGLAKVLDFGIAKLTESQPTTSHPDVVKSISVSQAGLVIGSARYMSPEQARGQSVDPRSDTFSLGVVLYEMAGGTAPFDGETVSDVIAEILKVTPPSLEEILPDAPSGLQRIVSKAMCKDRAGRYQSAKEMLDDLEEFARRRLIQVQNDGASSHQGKTRVISGNKSQSATGTASHPAERRLRRLPASLLLSLALVVVIALAALYLLKPLRNHGVEAPQAGSRTLAILPFQNLRQDPSLNYLGFSLADAVITKLSSINSLTIRPSTSIEKYRNQSVDPRTAGADLNVNTLLTGGFIKDGDDLRITAQLVDLKLNKILWHDSFDVKFDKLLTVQDHVAQQIAKGLELDLSPSEAQNLNSSKPVDPKAYEYYLRGIDLDSINDFPGAVAMLEKSVSLDPNFALSWAHLGKAYSSSATLQFGGREVYDKAQAAYEKAIALDPNLVEPRIYMANMLTDTGRVEQAVPILRAALKSNPQNAELHWELGYAYRFAGMLPQSASECEHARQIDPQVKLNSSAFNAYLYLGEYARFLESLPSTDSAYILFYRGFAEFYLGHPDEAAKLFDRAYMLDPELLQPRIGKALSDKIAGRPAAGLALLHDTQDKMEDRGVGDAESMYKIAQAYAVLGDKPDALHALSHTVEGGFFCSYCFSTDPLLAGIRSEHEFQRLSNDARQRHDEFESQFFGAASLH